MDRRDDQSGPRPQRFGWFGPGSKIVKRGRDAATVVHLAYYGDRVAKIASRLVFAFGTVVRRPDGQYNLDDPIWTMVLRNKEAASMLAFLREGAVAATQTVDSTPAADPDSSIATPPTLIDSAGIDTTSLVEALTQRKDVDALVAGLAATEEGLSAAQGAVISQRRDLVRRLRLMAEDPVTTESDLQQVMGDAYWLFGGRYIGVAAKRNLVPLDQHDIPLIGADGTVHIVELKGPNIPNLVRKHRNHWIVGSDVHEATSQAMNYLRNLDETGATLNTLYRNDFGVDYDMRRLFATVVIGHPAHVNHAGERVVEQTIRSYNAHLSRVEVITYATLLDTAERTLTFEDAARISRG